MLGWHHSVTWLQHGLERATAASARTDRRQAFGDMVAHRERRETRNQLGAFKKVDPPGGTTGRVGFSTGVDEAPVLDANPREALSRF